MRQGKTDDLSTINREASIGCASAMEIKQEWIVDANNSWDSEHPISE